jgi:hypothetical protein
MNDDRKTPASTWPPPGLGSEKGNEEKTVVARLDDELIQRLRREGSLAIDEPSDDAGNP